MSLFESIFSGIFGSLKDDDIIEEAVFCDDDEYDEEERISVWDAADIWRSRGRDEDYMFGYTEEELEDA